MYQPQEKIHGSLFLLFKRFVETNYSLDTWQKLTQTAGLSVPVYEIHHSYPASEMYSLLKTASFHMGFSENDLKEKFGEYLVPDLLTIYKSHVNPDWKTFEMLLNTEIVMHKAVRNQAGNPNPPILNITKVNDK